MLDREFNQKAGFDNFEDQVSLEDLSNSSARKLFQNPFNKKCCHLN